MMNSLFCLFAFGMMSLRYLTATIPSEDVIENEEYKVYSVLLSDIYLKKSTKLLVISDSTLTREELNLDYEMMSEIRKNYPSILKDFKVKNSSAAKLDNLFKLRCKSLLIRQDELDQIFASDGSSQWQMFSQKYPGADGIIWLSRIGFDDKRQYAVVYAESVIRNFSGGGYYYILQKKNGIWKIKYKEMSWVS